MYVPKNAEGKLPAIAVSGPFGACKEQSSGLYAQETAERGFGIVVESWYPFGGRGHTQERFSNEVISELAEKYGKTPAQIILRWQLQSGFVAIPGSSNPEHIAETFDIFGFELTADEMKLIRRLERQARYENW